MSGSSSGDRGTADRSGFDNWRSRKKSDNVWRKADGPDVGFQRHFQKRSQHGEQSYIYRRNQHEAGGSRGKSMGQRPFSRGSFNTQPVNSFTRSRNSQHTTYATRNSSSSRSTDGCDQYNIQYFDSTHLEQLNKLNSDNLLTMLLKQKRECEQFLNSTFTPDVLVLTLSVLANLCRGNFTESVASILSRACSNTFLRSVESYLMSLCFEEESVAQKSNKLYWNSRNEFWQNLIDIFQKMIDVLPSKARDELTGILGKINRIITNIENNQDYAIPENVKTTLSEMSNQLQEQLNKVEKKYEIRELRSKQFHEDPPENFRSLSVIPSKEDLFNSHPFIRANKVKEAYDSVEHYLDVQFRLLREDFIAPFRDGLEEYLNEPTQRRNRNLRIYRKVRFVFYETAESHSGSRIFFGVKNWNWKDSKRLMFGGLVCLSKDNFNTTLFATVANRNENDLKEGIVVINPCSETEITRDFYDCDFVMLESKLYFEPYFVVLNAMRHMNDGNFPMKNYLVDADTSTFRPRYLNIEEIELVYEGFQQDSSLPVAGAQASRLPTERLYLDEMQEQLGIDETFLPRFFLPVAANAAWPSAEQLQLDEMQYKAFRCALTEEFSVIQGPPGTGKTFLALQIIRTMLLNSFNWRRYGPIVVVCLTNHALDQFLEGILEYTNSIVRIGSRSKNPKLDHCTLKNQRYPVSWGGIEAQDNMHYAKVELNKNLELIQDTYRVIRNLTEENAIVHLHDLQHFCDSPLLNDFKDNQALLSWLLGINSNSTPVMIAYWISQGMELPWQDKLFRSLLWLKFSEVVYPLKCVDEMIVNLNTEIDRCRKGMTEIQELPFDPTNEWVSDIYELQILRAFLQENLAFHPLLNMVNRGCCQHPRWEAYWRWIALSYENAVRHLVELQKESKQLNQELNEAKQIVDLEVLRAHKVIGITTTAGARLHASLRALGAPIVLVEEAAEILEAHVVCSLTKNCQQVILIGDHKQLRPKAAVYKLGTKYNLNVSLFERMVNIKGNHTQLANQHRMRPEIARLICPSIYETLHNHESVYNYPSVKGLTRNLFFLHHTHTEVIYDYNEDSWTNPHEAAFFVAFARHLLLQGYAASEITILCTYAGQLFTFMKEKDCYPILRDLRVTTIDNYQGEENKIILLSLVRNNEEGNVGFLREENRVCVALSRAREGLYVMGNMDNLTSNNHIWPKVKEVLEEADALGNSLELQCQIHCGELTRVKDAMDFQKCPEGGCSKMCNADLPCGHNCLSVCHTLDQEHNDYNCKQPCVKPCPNGHRCPFACSTPCKPCLVFEDKELKCGHTVSVPCWADCDTFPCPVRVDAILPDCKHAVVKPCHKSLKDYPCSHPCDVRAPCGHSCELHCHVNSDPDHLKYKCEKDCTKNNLGCTMEHACKKRCGDECTLCDVKIKKKRSCGHYFDCNCSQDVEEIVCIKPCKLQMDCGHMCQLKCNQICGICGVEVEKTSSCGHKMIVRCDEEATPSKCCGECQCKLACGHPCTAKCKDPCITMCKVMVPQTKPGLCGHIFSVPCYMQESEDAQKLLRYCKEPCKTELACGHTCKGNCGYCKQGRIHMPCGENCGNILICGHRCEVPCRQECPPCKKVCEVRCRHNRCNRKCGEPCAPCKEKCGWGCPHSRCSKRCFELCDREPCEEPCLKVLKCGHPCVGFCGEPCPKLCRICDKEKLIDEFFLGYEDEPDARFVLLEDCGHFIESQGLLKWVSECDESIQMKTCPRCKTLISKCMRIMNQIKRDVKDVQLIKNKLFGEQTQLQNEQRLLLYEIELMAKNPVVKIFSELQNFLDALRPKVLPVTKKKKRQILDVRATEATKITINFLQQIFEKLEKIDHTVKIYPWLQDQLLMLLQSLSTRGQISTQEINDIQPELRRLHYMAEICKMDLETVFKNSDSLIQHEISFIAVIDKLTSIEKFSETTELAIKSEIIRLAPLIEVRKAIIIDVERKMIVKAMGFKQGHWFKCPNGHIYSIGDCGGAMQESQCNECGASIGGGSHRLRSDNSLATEMDGATRSAWPGGI